MPFVSPAQSQLDEINEQMELFSRWDNLLKFAHKLVDAARSQRRACKQTLRELERTVADILSGPALAPT